MALATNPRRRRRRSGVARVARRSRRRFRRNPPFAVRSIVGDTMDGLKNGAAVTAGQVIARKIKGAILGMVPPTNALVTGFGGVGITLGAAVATSVAVKYLPAGLRRYAQFIVAGAFSEAINAAVAQTPIAPYLSAYPTGRVLRVAQPGTSGRRVGAYPVGRVGGGAGLGAYPQVAMPYTVGT